MCVFGFPDSLSMQFLLLSGMGKRQKFRHNKFSNRDLKYKGKMEGKEKLREKNGNRDTNISVLLINMFPGCNRYPL